MESVRRVKPDPRINPWRDDLAAEYLRGKVAAPAYTKGINMMVCAPVTALRRGAAHGAVQDSQLLFGEIFCVYDQRGIWAWGQSRYDDYVGYVLAENLGLVEIPTHYVTALRSFAFVDVDIKSRPLMAVSMGARVRVVGQRGRFAELSDGSFIYADHLALLGHWQSDCVEVARRFIGTPYLWGGRDSLGLDCSALVQIALMQCGYACPRDTDIQEQILGRTMAVDAARQRGDLVFWKGHVGLLTTPQHLLHANAMHMAVVEEEFDQAVARINDTDGPVTRIKRL